MKRAAHRPKGGIVVDEEIEVLREAMLEVASGGRRTPAQVEARIGRRQDLKHFVLERVEPVEKV